MKTIRMALALMLASMAFSLGGCATVLESSSSGMKASGQWMAGQGKSSDDKGNTTLGSGWKAGAAVHGWVGGFLDTLAGKKTDTAAATNAPVGNRTGTDRIEGK
jgi:hypothetical protein